MKKILGSRFVYRYSLRCKGLWVVPFVYRCLQPARRCRGLWVVGLYTDYGRCKALWFVYSLWQARRCKGLWLIGVYTDGYGRHGGAEDSG
ncbi:hypothetical protein FKM82_026799 [Ascaphus truei]